MKGIKMKTVILSGVLASLAMTSSLAMAAVGVNHNGPQLNPYAQSNAQIAKQDVKAEQVQVANRLNAKEINPLFKVAGEYQQGTGKGYFVRGELK